MRRRLKVFGAGAVAATFESISEKVLAESQPLETGRTTLQGRNRLMSMFDVCIIGSGPAGSVCAARLVAAGARVAVVEVGSSIERNTPYEHYLLGGGPCIALDLDGSWRDDGHPWTTCNVGGGGEFYAGILFRLRDVDFDAGQYARGTDLPVAWPIAPCDLAPHYNLVEREIGICGRHDADPTAPTGAQPFAHAPLPATWEAERLSAAAVRMGLRPFPTPTGFDRSFLSQSASCACEDPCVARLCRSGARITPYSRYLAPAVRTGGATLFERTLAVRLSRGAGSEVTSLECMSLVDKSTFRIAAATFVLAANAIQSAALLLRSTDGRSRTGLGNEYDMVGRSLCMKLARYVRGKCSDAAGRRQPALSPTGGPYSTVSLTDWYRIGSNQFGGVITEARGQGYKEGAASGDAIRVECVLADTPLRRNRVINHPSVKHSWGIPQVAIQYTPLADDQARLDRMTRLCGALLINAGCNEIDVAPYDAHLGSCHLHGTLRSGDNPSTSVCDADGRLHTVPNVFVADGGYMPFPGAVHPTLTIMAVASRTAEVIVGTAQLRPLGGRP